MLLLLGAACSGSPREHGSTGPSLLEQNALPSAGDIGPDDGDGLPDRRGRAVAALAASRPVGERIPPIVVHGHEPALPAAMRAPPDAGEAADKTGKIKLNFANADIRDVAAAVLGRMLKRNYVIDPAVTGPITFDVSRPLTRDEVLPTFEAILNSRGATMSEVNGMIRIMPLPNDAKRGRHLEAGHGGGTQALPLRFVGATEMQHVLEKVLPPGQPIFADNARHLLIVQGTPSELQLAADTVRVFDIDQLSGMSMAVVPLQQAEPTAVADELRDIFAATRNGADADAIRFATVKRLNAVMVLSHSDRYLDEARAWIARLDRSRPENDRHVYVYNLQYGKAAQIGEKLQGVLSSIDIHYKGPSTASSDGLGTDSGDKPKAKVQKSEANLGQLVASASADDKPRPQPVSATSALLGPATVAAGGQPTARPASAAADAGDRSAVRVEADEAHNALLISATPRDYELIRQVLQGIDVPPLQVLIEVTVAEVTLNDELNYGVEYFLNSGHTNTLLTAGTSAASIVPNTPGFALSWLSGNFKPQAILQALSQITQTRVISTPRLLVVNNQTARLQVGDVVPIITQSETSTVTSNAPVINNVTYKETGVVLEVTPRVNAGGFVTLDVNQAVSDVVRTESSDINSPTIRQRRLESTISVKSGQSILLGGLIKQQDTRGNSGIPFLSDVPGVGALFGTRTNSAARTELIMLMTPRVIANDDQARNLTWRVERQFQAVLDGSTMVPPRTLPTR